MERGFWYAPDTEETSVLSSIPLNSIIRREVRVVKNLYRNEDNGFSVYEVEDDEHRWFKITGYFPAAMRFDTYYMVEGPVKDGKYGRTLQVSNYKSALPQTEEGIITTLRTLPRLDTRAPFIYQELGDKCLDLILEHPDIVAQRIKGVGLKLAKEWQSALQNLKESDVVLQVLQNYQIPLPAAKQLIEKYPDIIERLKKSPYFLVTEVKGFTFPKCDKIALDNGYPLNGLERLQQAMLYVLTQAGVSRGDCYMDKADFIETVRKTVDVRIDFRTARSLLRSSGPLSIQIGTQRIDIERTSIEEAIKKWQKAMTKKPFFYTCKSVPAEDLSQSLNILCGANKIVIDEDRIYIGTNYQAEVAIARCLKAMVASEYGWFNNVEQVLDQICVQEGVSLEEKQREAVLRFCQARGGVFILNGRAGCGKTFTLNIILKVLSKLYEQQGLFFSAKIMAPTGKAAQVAHKSTNLPACTVHKALHLVADNNQETDVSIGGECVVIDEFSMMGLFLSATLLKAIQPGVKTIIMGDFEQLPSIEPGNVLYDIIFSGAVPVVTLNVVKRQADGSGILYNANQILDGKMIHSKIVTQNGIANNAYIFKADSEQECRDSIVKMVVRMKSQGYSMDDIQVLCPQKKTDVGIDSLNYFIQAAVNPVSNSREVISKNIVIHDHLGREQNVKLVFRERDKVIHTVNDYNMKFYNFKRGEGFVEDYSRLGIVNGETGRIAKIIEVKDGSTSHLRIYVKYGANQYALYEDDWSALSLSYAMTIHRAQGSQWPVVIAPIMFCNKSMLTRRLFYTLYTRAETVSLIYCTAAAVQYAIANNITAKRKTWLKERLQMA